MRRRRPLAAFLAVIALVLGQFMVSAHACEQSSRAPKGEVAAQSVHCHGVVDEAGSPGNLCEQHCQYGESSVDSTWPATAAADLSGPYLRIEPATVLDDTSAPPLLRRQAPTAAPPPAAILFGVLRI